MERSHVYEGSVPAGDGGLLNANNFPRTKQKHTVYFKLFLCQVSYMVDMIFNSSIAVVKNILG